MEYRATRWSLTGTVVVIPVPSDTALRSVAPFMVAASSVRAMASFRLPWAVVTDRSSSLQSVQVPMVPIAVTVACSDPPGQPFPSGVVEHYSAPPQLPSGTTSSEDLQGPMDLIREQREAGNLLAAWPPADLESLRNGLTMEFVTDFRLD